MWAVKPVRKSVTLNPWGMYAAGENEKNEPRGGKTFRLQRHNGVDFGGALGVRCNQARRKGVKRERPVGWRASAGSTIWDLKGSQQEVDGLQRGSLIRYVVPMRAVNGTPVVGNMEP